MRKIGLKSSSSQENEDKSAPKEGMKGWFKNNQRPIIAVGMIVILAFVLRMIFSYGVSAGSGFALSGGTSASEHLHTIVEIVTAGTIFGADGALYYPFGSANVNPPLMDLILGLFAMIGKACGMSAVSASEAVLGWSAVIFGTLACIPMYYLGKEMLGSKTAGYLSALFLALCPVVITQTVFSNGTEIAFVAFLFILMAYFMVKGIKVLDNNTAVTDKIGAVYATNKAAMKYALISGIFMALIAYSWNGFRSIIVVLIFIMAIMVLLGRFKSKDTRSVAMYFSIIILMGVVLAAPYYILAGLWNLVFSGVCIASLLAVVVCMLFAITQDKPWTLTIPAFAIVLIALFAVLFIAAPAYFSAIVGGNSAYVGDFASLMSSNGLSLSVVAANFGFLTMWFGLIMVGYMLYKLPKNISSMPYVFVIILMAFGMYYGVTTTANATVFAPVFAIGFAAVIIWLFKNVDFKGYFTSFKGVDIKSVWKKLLKPTPFVSILVVLFMICAPNAIYAIDGSISNNETDKYNDQLDDVFQKELVGSLGYYIKTDSDWKVNSILSDYNGTVKDGSLVTWVDYSSDSATFGDFSSIVDTRGNGTSAMANILLSNGSNGASTSAMLLYLISYYGIDSCKTALTSPGLMSSAQFEELKNIINNPSEYRNEVLENPNKYGILATTVSNENITYLYGENYFIDNFSTYQISDMYENIAEVSGKNISYFMVSGNMFPIYYGYSSVFATISHLNGYALSDSYGTVSQFLVINSVTQSYGVYGFTDAMYDTLMWRSYVGMSPAEAGFTGTNAVLNYISALSLSDGTYKATPGYGLSNYAVDYDHWYVMYNSDSEATLSSDGWEKMLYTEAVSAQEENGGFINYLSGLPVIMKYVENGGGSAVSGTVVDSTNAPVKGVRVAVFDSNGIQRSTTFTDVNGKYTALVTDDNSKITFAAGVSTLTGGSTIKTIDYSGEASIEKVVIPATTLSGTLVTSDSAVGDLSVRLVGTTSGKIYEPVVDPATKAFSVAVVPDTYTITAFSGKTVYKTTSYLTAIGVNSGLEISLDSAQITVTLKDDLGVIVSGVAVTLTNTASGSEFTGTTDADGKVVIMATPGTYSYSLGTGYATTTAAVTLDADDKETATVTAIAAKAASITGFPVGQMAIIYNSSYQSAEIVKESFSVNVPTGTAGGAIYSIYSTSTSGTAVSVYWGTTADTSVSAETGYLVSGILKNSSGNAKSGTIVFIDSENGNKMVPVSADSEGKYSVYLPEGSYIVYATDNSAYVYIGKLSVTGDLADNTITMEAARKVSGYTYWYSSTYKMEYVPITVSGITDVDVKLNFLSGSDAAYSFYIPSGKGCTVTSTLGETSGYYYMKENEKVTSLDKTIESGSSSSTGNNFTASAYEVSVKNGSESYSVTVGGTLIPAGETKNIAITSTTVSVIVDGEFGGKYYYYNGSTSVTPGVDVKTIDVDATKYSIQTVNVPSESDVVTITATDGGVQKDKTPKGTARVYYLEDGKEFLVKVVDSENSKIGYAYTSETYAAITVTLTDSVNVKGFVGLAAAGTLTVSGITPSLTFDISSSGKYDIVLPSASSYTFGALVTKTVNDVETQYNATRTVSASEVTGDINVINMSVRGTAAESTPEEGDMASKLTIDSMTINNATKKADVQFTSVITGAEAKTYKIAGGTSWIDVMFYSDKEMTTQITTITGSGTFYGKGTFSSSAVAAGSSTLSVVLTDLNGNASCTGTFDKTDAKWVKTTASAETTKVNYGADVINDSEYMYAVAVVNDDNYTKTFTFSTEAITETGWFVSYVYNDNIVQWTATGVSVTVDGYSTQTVYFKVTSMGAAKEMPASIVDKVTVAEVSAISTDDDTGGITINGNVATVKAEKMEASVSITDYTATGNGVYNDKGSMPAYIWIIFAVMIILVILVVWLGMRRGVFARKN